MANEKRLIYADDLRQHWLENGENEHIYDTNAFLDSIDEQPTVDAVPVVHGRWVDTGKTYEDEKCRYNYWECSECNNQIAGRYGLHNYCPNCGAKMDGGADNG